MRIVSGNFERAVAGLLGAVSITALMLALPTLSGRGSGLVARARAQEGTPIPFSAVCSNATLTGSYGFQRHGTKTDGTLITSVGNLTFDGQGNVLGGQEWTMRNGVLTYRTIPAGSYVVNSDCSGQLVDPTLVPISDFVVVHRGRELLGMSLSAGNSVWARFERAADPPGAAGVAPNQQ